MKSIKFLKLVLVLVSFIFVISFLNHLSLAKMSKQRTFGIIKPSGLAYQDEIRSMISSSGLLIKYSKKIVLTEEQFEKLYVMHKEKPFFRNLRETLVGKEMVVFILYGDDAVEKYREVIKEIRSKYAINKTENAVHGSDSVDRAREEINIFFKCNNRVCK